MDYQSLIPRDKHDTAAVLRARDLGFPALNPVLPDLLQWLQDLNWPVTQDVADLLSGADLEIVPHIRYVFLSDDSIWKHGLLTALCPRLSPLVLAELRPDFVRLAFSGSDRDRAEEVDQAAAALLP